MDVVDKMTEYAEARCLQRGFWSLITSSILIMHYILFRANWYPPLTATNLGINEWEGDSH